MAELIRTIIDIVLIAIMCLALGALGVFMWILFAKVD